MKVYRYKYGSGMRGPMSKKEIINSYINQNDGTSYSKIEDLELKFDNLVKLLILLIPDEIVDQLAEDCGYDKVGDESEEDDDAC